MLCERVSYQVGNRGNSPSSAEADTSLLSAHGAVSHTREILQSTDRATRLALSHLSDAAWWKRTLGNLRPTRPTAAEQDDRNTDLHRLGCHPFYESLHTDCYVNKVTALLCVIFRTSILCSLMILLSVLGGRIGDVMLIWNKGNIIQTVCPVWLSGNTLASINVVALRQTRLVLGWVTVCGRVNHLGM